MIVFEFVLTLLLAYIFIKIIKTNAFKFGLMDIPNGRSAHKKETPRGAGIGFVLALFIGLFAFEWQLVLEHWHILLALFMVFIVGILDDQRDATPKTKFYVIGAAVVLLWFNGLSIDSLGKWYEFELNLGWFALPFSLFAILGFTNALNLVDGKDGLAASISIVILFTLALIGFKYDDYFIVTVSVFTIAVLMAFLYYNWHPARIFMGDSGSLSLGFLISVLAVLSLEHIHPVVVLYLAAIPILDTIIVFTRRVRNGASPFVADKTHLYHVLYKFFNYDQRKTVMFLVLLQIVFGYIGYVLTHYLADDHHGVEPITILMVYVIIILYYMISTSILVRQRYIEILQRREEIRKRKKRKET